jgi:3-(3-hydroxy-phenyl)propionate hydroxylase
LRWKNKVISVAQTDDEVTATVETPAGRYRLTADWLVDATGVNSGIRQGFGLDPHTSRIADRWCITDVRFKEKFPVERWTWVEAPFNENRAVWQHPMADDVWRLDYQMPSDCDPDYVSRRDVAEDRLRAHLGDIGFELVWVGPYEYRDHLLDEFRHGRVFFIGDAAHVVSPFGARGGNSGVQDADNLGWKLAVVLLKQAPVRLLETYDAERRAGKPPGRQPHGALSGAAVRGRAYAAPGCDRPRPQLPLRSTVGEHRPHVRGESVSGIAGGRGRRMVAA